MALNRSQLLRPATPIQDSEIEAEISQLSFSGYRVWCDAENAVESFFEKAQSWFAPFLGENDLRKLEGRFLSSGTTGSFQNFYQINSQRRLRVLPGEYPFHRDLYSKLGLSWKWLDIADLHEDDCVIMSVPFSGDGNVHPLLMPILRRCEDLRIPVLLDCAFAGLSDLKLPNVTSFSCVHTLTFSLSKFFNIGHLRCGFEFSKYDLGANALLSEWDYGPKAAAYFAKLMMERFPVNYLQDKYRERQLKICHEYGLTPSATILFGLGDASWKEFSRDGFANRVCLSEVL